MSEPNKPHWSYHAACMVHVLSGFAAVFCLLVALACLAILRGRAGITAFVAALFFFAMAKIAGGIAKLKR